MVRVLRAGAVICCCASTGVIGCGGDTTGPAPLTASQAYWALRLNYHAVNLALTPPYNSVQLTATPFNALGDSLPVAGPIQFTTADSTVIVDSTGLVTANYRTTSVKNPTHVIASLQYQGVTLADTVAIQVTATAPVAPVATLQLQPAAGGSPLCHINSVGFPFTEDCGPLVATATDTHGDTVANAKQSAIVITYASSDPFIATIDQSGKIVESDTGHVTFSVSTWAYGVAIQDSLKYIISWPKVQWMQLTEITPVNSLTPIIIFPLSPLTIGVGGTVAWLNGFDQRIDIVFDDSSVVESGCLFARCDLYPSTGSGNIPPFYYDATGTDTSIFARAPVARSFPVAGTYHYHSTIYPSSTGVIYVREDLSQ